ncbi:HK97 family phage prohead protease [Rhizobium ruizarguesonis]|uniref:HK97 family phage prohead protease n=1 Tax=Rhizobium ruizarguesonis TaxID=2081791 RepID=UPI0014483738|nr:hypothetical protein [Rhizobium ruizarguesonis]
MVIPRVTPAWINHDPLQQVAATDDGSFRIRCDDIGLRVELDCPHTDVGDRLLHGSRFGEFTGWSISFRATEETRDRSGPRPLRIVARANVIEVSIADRGAHVTTLGVLSRMRSEGAARSMARPAVFRVLQRPRFLQRTGRARNRDRCLPLSIDRGF